MAERLTINEAIAHAREVAEKNRTNCKPNTITMPNRWISNIDCAEEHEQLAEWLEELKHYKDLEEQGRLIELPCKIGDTVYGHFQCYNGKEIRECKVIEIRACHFKANSECYYFVDVEFNIIDPFYMDGRLMTCRHQAVIGNDYGSWERVFFTREEAEKAE